MLAGPSRVARRLGRVSRPTLFTALRTARLEAASPAAGARAFGRAAIFTGLLVLGRALWLRAASRRFRRIRGTRVGTLDGPRTALRAGGASGGPASSGASWSSGRRDPADGGGRASGADSEGVGHGSSGSSSSSVADAGYVDGTAEALPPEESA